MRRGFSKATKYTAALALAGMMMAGSLPVLSVSAANGYAPAEDRRPIPEYKVTIHWEVVNDYDDGDTYGNVISLYTLYPKTINWRNEYTNYTETDNKDLKNVAKDKGSHSVTYTVNGVPEKIYYQSYGKTRDVSEWYITEIDVAPVNVVEESGKPKSVVFWKGKLGCKTKGVGGTYKETYLDFSSGEPVLKSWSGDALYTEKYFKDMGKGITPAGVTPLKSDYTDVYVPTSDSSARNTYTLTGGVAYDQYGAMLTNQTGYYKADHGYVRYTKDGTFYIENFANDKEDYDVTLTKIMNYGNSADSTSVTKKFRVHTFDYTLNFIDGYGNKIKTETIDYGDSATPPSIPKYIAKNGYFYKFERWFGTYKNVKSGAKNANIEALYYDTSSFFAGSGTKTDPYIIGSALQWEQLGEYIKSVDASQMYFKLAKDLTVDKMVGNENYPFTGTFDGNNKTLTVNYDVSDEYAAPFRYTNNAVIKNLHTAGTVKTSAKYSAGVAGSTNGTTTIENCRSSVIIDSSVNGDGTHGGLVAVANNSSKSALNINGCVFDGKFLGKNTTSCGGFIGWRSSAVQIKDSLFDPAEIGTNQSESAMFARNKADTVNSYYLSSFGFDTGKQWLAGHNILNGKNTNVAFDGKSTEYNTSGITSYGTGLLYKGKMYAGKNEIVSLKLSSTAPEGMECKGYTVNVGTLEGSKLTMPDTDATVSAVFEKKHVHKYHDKVTKPATCTEDGVITYTCDCGDSYTEVIPSTGHDFSTKWTIDEEPTCTEKGSKSHHCKNCDEVKDITEIPALGHSWDDGVITKEATCHEDGEKVYTCTVCGETKTEIIPAELHFSKAPKCVWTKKNGYIAEFAFICDDCGEAVYYDAEVTSVTEDDYITYTAKAVVGGKEYVATKSFKTETNYTQSLVATVVGKNAIKLSWQEDKYAEKYGVASYQNGKWSVIAECKNNTYVVNDLTPDTTYTYAIVTMTNGIWNTGSVDPIKVTLPVFPEPTEIKYNSEYHQVRISWTSVNGATDYGIAVKLAGKWRVQAYTDASTTTFTTPKLRPGSTYDVVICAKVNGKWQTQAINARAFRVTVE